ncbi:MAG: M56 family metallopeptidase [Bacteroidales bacterium]|nr:M56 family metallopeptidase [Bacteroidales bacterium]
MSTFFTIDFWNTFMLPSALSLAVFYLFYKAIVRNDTHFKIRRFTILGFLVFAMVLPFLNFQMPTNAGVGGGWGVLNMPIQLPIFTVFADGNVGVDAVETQRIASLQMINILVWIYLAIVLFFVIRGIVGILRLASFSKNGKRLETTSETIITSPDIPTAFSFFNTVYIPEKWEDSDEKDMVLTHERVHVKQKHSWDLMLMEVICAVQFFNPFVWLLKREMRLNHEYLADTETLKNNKNPESYFQFLLQEIVGRQPILAHSLHYSPIKNRIMMQLTKPAKVLNQVRYLAFIPVVLALTFLFACQENPEVEKDEFLSEVLSAAPVVGNPIVIIDGVVFDGTIREIDAMTPPQNIESVTVLRTLTDDLINRLGLHNLNIEHGVILITTKSSENQTDFLSEVLVERGGEFVPQRVDPPIEDPDGLVYILVEDSPGFPGGVEAMQKFLRDNIRYPVEARDKGIQGVVVVAFVIERDGRISNARVLRGIGGGADEEAVRVISMMPNWTPGKQGGRPVRVQFSMPIRFTLAGETE